MSQNTWELNDMDYSMWSDMHKDVYGTRPRREAPFKTVSEYMEVMDNLEQDLRYQEESDRYMDDEPDDLWCEWDIQYERNAAAKKAERKHSYFEMRGDFDMDEALKINREYDARKEYLHLIPAKFLNY